MTISNSILLPHMGCLRVEGRDAVVFLQGQVTCDVVKLATNNSTFGALCNAQGRVVSLFHLFKADSDCILLVMPRRMINLTLSTLKKFAIFYKTQLTDTSHAYLIQGIHCQSEKMDAYRAKQTVIQYSDDRYLLIEEKATTITDDCTLSPWHLLDIEECFPSIYLATSGLFLPHDINLDLLGAIHFDKGCYTGQEIISRMHYRGKLKKRLLQIEIKHKRLPKPGEWITLKNSDYSQETQVVDSVPLTNNTCKLLIIASEEQRQLVENKCELSL